MSVTISYGVIGWLLHRLFDQAECGIVDIDTWGQRFTVFSSVAGLTWGMAGYALFVQDAFAPQTIVGALIFGGAAAQMTFTVVHKPAFYLSVALLLIPTIIRFAVVWDGLHLLISMGCVIYHGMLVHLQIEFTLDNKGTQRGVGDICWPETDDGDSDD